ncbi:hypothetical protein K2P97_03490 [bacterium]|nr:hypothetical protein [bacterium]
MAKVFCFILIFSLFENICQAQSQSSDLSQRLLKGRPQFAPPFHKCTNVSPVSCQLTSNPENGSAAYKTYFLSLGLFYALSDSDKQQTERYQYLFSATEQNKYSTTLKSEKFMVEDIKGDKNSVHRLVFYKIESGIKSFDFMLIVDYDDKKNLSLVRCKNKVVDISKDDCQKEDKVIGIDQIFYILAYASKSEKEFPSEFMLRPNCDILFENDCMLYAIWISARNYLKIPLSSDK